MTKQEQHIVDQPTPDTTGDGERDAILREMVGGQYRPTSPRNVFERANQYIPTRVRAASVGE